MIEYSGHCYEAKGYYNFHECRETVSPPSLNSRPPSVVAAQSLPRGHPMHMHCRFATRVLSQHCSLAGHLALLSCEAAAASPTGTEASGLSLQSASDCAREGGGQRGGLRTRVQLLLVRHTITVHSPQRRGERDYSTQHAARSTQHTACSGWWRVAHCRA